MPEARITCVAAPLKAILLRELDHLEDKKQRRQMEDLLEDLPDCKAGQLVGIETGRGKKEKRPPSEYNLFVRECMAQRPSGTGASDYMKTCAVKWREEKKRNAR